MLSKIGDPCGADADCSSGSCYRASGAPAGFCTQTCVRSSTCTNAGGNAGLACVPAGNSSLCVPTCASAAACLPFGASYSCRNIKSTDGLVSGACNVWRNQPLGYPCQSDGQCASGTCGGYWCNRSCASNSDCTGENWCVRNQANVYRCFPQCSNNDDCAIYGAGVKCYLGVTTVSGSKFNICAL